MFRRFTFLALIACAIIAVAACRRSANDAHYAALESNRQQQAAQPAPSATAAPSPSPSASASPSPGQTPAEPAKNYWTNFRGPRRDGRYEEANISTNWPANGLPVVWKQPVGVGHASFVVA